MEEFLVRFDWPISFIGGRSLRVFLWWGNSKTAFCDFPKKHHDLSKFFYLKGIQCCQVCRSRWLNKGAVAIWHLTKLQKIPKEEVLQF
jgi:hypothetical protein